MTKEQELLRLYTRSKQNVIIEDVNEVIPHLEYMKTNAPELWAQFLKLMRELKLQLIETDFDNRQTKLFEDEEND